MGFPAGNRGFGDDPLMGVGVIAMALALVLVLEALVLAVLLRGDSERQPPRRRQRRSLRPDR